MSIDYKRVYQEFEKLKEEKDLSEYSSELYEINRLLNTVPFDSTLASRACSFFASKYESEINILSGQLGGTRVVKGMESAKTAIELYNDLLFFKNHIPVFAFIRKSKTETAKALLGL